MSQSEPKKDYYSILGSSQDASQEELERLYKRLAVRHHPDRGGDEEEMKAINEAYGVLGNVDARRAYDASRPSRQIDDFAPPFTSPSVQADLFSGRIVGALVCLAAGLVLLLVVRFHFIWFLWPLAILAAFVIFLGIWMAHAALAFARESVGPEHPARRFIWAQELLFWSLVCAGGYGVYLILSLV